MPEKILVIRFGSLGDVILASAPVLNLKITYPRSKVLFLTKEEYRETVGLFTGVDQIVTLPAGASQVGLFRTILELDRENITHCLDLHGNLRSWVSRNMINADLTAIYASRRWERLRLVKTTWRPQSWPHTIDLYNRAARRLGAATACNRPMISINRGSPGPALLPADRPVVAIAPGAAHANKQWPLERFKEVASQLVEQTGAFIVWILTAVDAQRLTESSEGSEDACRLVAKSIPEIAEILEHCTITLANDSGIAHLSSATGTPTLALFGPTHQALGFAPRGLRDQVMEVDEFCRPCSRHGKKPCYREEQFCFTRISATEVVERATVMLTRQQRSKPALFIDRDGTLIVNKHYLSNPDDVELESGAVEGLRIAHKKGYKLVIVSNQSGVARGMFSIGEVEKVNARLSRMLAQQGVALDSILYCPHHPTDGTNSQFTQVCSCRKPGAGMVEQAADSLNLDVRKSWVIGDSIDDYNLAAVTGARPLLVRTGHGARTEEKLEASGVPLDPVVFDGLAQVSRFLPQAGG